jgi:hypothetical protein
MIQTAQFAAWPVDITSAAATALTAVMLAARV